MNIITLLNIFLDPNCASALPIPAWRDLVTLGELDVSPGAFGFGELYSPALLGQPSARHPVKQDKIRDLEWGDINFLHTTDTHGWLAGHILEAEFSGDWGDFVSFSEHMKRKASNMGVDLLLVDSGDRHDGNGLSDASKHDGSLSLPIFCEIDYDVVTIGNHELYRGVASLQEYHKIRKHFGDRYVVSNVDVAIGKTWRPLGQKYRLFTTETQKKQVLALGFLFDFTGNDKDITKVTPVAEELKKEWFQTLMRDVVPHVDHVLMVSHIPARGSPEFEQILAEIRKVNSDVPVSMFGGHSHIRDFKVYDDNAVALQSGRYVETIGWASVNYTISHESTQFGRSYIDFNARTMKHHALEEGVDSLAAEDVKFATPKGKEVSKMIDEARSKLNLDDHIADVDKDYYTDRAPYPSEDSIYSLLVDEVLPLLTSPDEIRDQTRYIYLNTGGIRFDLFKGPYTKDSGYILSPFNNEWFYIRDIPRHTADQILPIINGESKVLINSKSRFQNEHRSISKTGSNGYVTEDDFGKGGDDTVHHAWTFYPIPNCVQSVVSSGAKLGNTEEETVTLVFHDFLAYFVQRALVELNQDNLFNPTFHGGEKVIDLIPKYLNSK